MAQALVEACLNQGQTPKKSIFVQSRNPKKCERFCEKFQVQQLDDKEELLEKTDLIFLCVKPSSVNLVLDDIANHFERHHTLISVVAGCSIQKLKQKTPHFHRVVRLMPSLSVKTGRGLLPFAVYQNKESLKTFVSEMLKPLGKPLALDDEENLRALTIASASGLGFILEIMEYWIEWLSEQGFSQAQAQEMTKEIFYGSAKLSLSDNSDVQQIQKMVCSKGGVTSSGLSSMRELELERILRLSFEQAVMKEKQLEIINE